MRRFHVWPRFLVLLLFAGCAWSMHAPAVCAAQPPDSTDFPGQGGGVVQVLLEETIQGLGLNEAVSDGRLAVALVLLNGNQAPGLGMLNGHRGVYAASLPKIAVLYGAAVALDEGRINRDEDLHADLLAMIRESCNPCTNRVLDRIGRDWLLELLQRGEQPFYDPEVGGGLWVGKDYARQPAYQRDPLQGFSHTATAWQAARFYFELIRGELASPSSTALMLEALSEPAIVHKFVAGLEGVDATLYRKSGTWRNYHADSVLVETKRGSYILVALARDPDGGAWLESLARALHEPVLDLTP